MTPSLCPPRHGSTPAPRTASLPPRPRTVPPRNPSSAAGQPPEKPPFRPAAQDTPVPCRRTPPNPAAPPSRLARSVAPAPRVGPRALPATPGPGPAAKPIPPHDTPPSPPKTRPLPARGRASGHRHAGPGPLADREVRGCNPNARLRGACEDPSICNDSGGRHLERHDLRQDGHPLLRDGGQVPVRRRPHRRRARQQAAAFRVVSRPPEGRAAPPERPAGQPAGRGLRLRRGVQPHRPPRAQAGHQVLPDLDRRLVAVRLRQLRPADDPHGLARRRHLPHLRRPRRRRRGPAALRPAQQLVGQRQHRQVPPPDLADQAEVRRRALLGRPDGADRQLRARDHGPADLRLRRRTPGFVGSRQRHLLGPRGVGPRERQVVRQHGHARPALARQERRRRLRPGEPARRDPPGADLREPRGLELRRRPDGLGARHPHLVQPHGDEQRGDGRPDRRRPRLRQEPRHGQG